MVLISCKNCKSKTSFNHNVKGTVFKNFLCNECKKTYKNFNDALKNTEQQQLFLKCSNDRINQDNQKIRQKENQIIPFNYWIIQERQAEKKFLEQQKNKDFLREQYLKDIEQVGY